MAFMSVAERESRPASDFAWPDHQPHPSYPITSQAHLDAAVKLLGRAPASQQARIKARIIAIAKRKGYTLPDSWQK